MTRPDPKAWKDAAVNAELEQADQHARWLAYIKAESDPLYATYLRKLFRCTLSDEPEKARQEATDALLAIIDDPTVTEMFNAAGGW